jgi:UDP-2,3-diacylglucosamine pyrophosphatase LpxH
VIIHTHPHEIELASGESIRIIAFGDVHYGASNCNVGRFEQNVIAAHAADPNAYFLDMGDSFDMITCKDWRYRPHEVMAELRGREDVVDAQVEGFAALWKKYDIPAHRFLGKLHGNHEDTILRDSGSNPTERYCYLTKQRNLGYCAYLRLLFRRGKSSSKHQVVLYLNHGFAGGRKSGSAMNAYTDHALLHQGVDIFLYGHNHRKWAHRVARPKPNWNTHEQDDAATIVGNTGTYLMTIGNDVAPGYAEKKGFPCVELGHLEIIATMKRDRVGKKERTWFDYRVVE